MQDEVMGFVVGILGEAVHILRDIARASALPEVVIVRFEGHTGLAWFLDPTYDGYVPTASVETTSSANGDDKSQKLSRQFWYRLRRAVRLPCSRARDTR